MTRITIQSMKTNWKAGKANGKFLVSFDMQLTYTSENGLDSAYFCTYN